MHTCVSSILHQSHPDFELIVVDDGSDNGIERYCDALGKEFGIKVIHQPNQGLSSVRNTGMKASSGEWIVHVDGDDWVDSRLVESLANSSADPGTDIVVWGFYVVNGKRKQELLLNDKEAFGENYEDLKERVLCSILDNDASFRSLALNTSWGKAYRRSFIEKHHLRYDIRLRRAQDAVYNLYAFSVAGKVAYIDRALNYYRTDNVSLSRGYNPRSYDFLRLTALAVEEFAARESTPERVKEASLIFEERCFRMINEQLYMPGENGLSFGRRKQQFLAGIGTEPFRNAFLYAPYRDGLKNRVVDWLYKKKLFEGIYIHSRVVSWVHKMKAMLPM